MKIYNIQWDIDLPNEIDIPLDELPVEYFPNYGRCETCEHYTNCNICSNCIGGTLYTFDTRYANNPEIIDSITEWLSDEYGFCVKGFSLDTDQA